MRKSQRSLQVNLMDVQWIKVHEKVTHTRESEMRERRAEREKGEEKKEEGEKSKHSLGKD